MTQDQPKYLAYMLRLWRVEDCGQAIWRASLESPHTGERLGFASLDMLYSFLQDQVGPLTPPAEAVLDQPEPAAGLDLPT